ncbi:endonuclease/exonuclease/phosphatase family protein [Companilactobacillus kimchiensis]|uniref:Endonuclease/exonuclease/phosphatase domain-containing protein n=1 Tax=Companilactobacillus kimchiensis TaxID=993692 RepID=A0A0R2LM69_9LACO|nr:endonuclease/exonuclease/phosphatase family protein [Companilactobacillus kimchiensis]KRO00077.1 hypothetical protein IV57_GL002093 [Companilactobacillus kimchiensis]
MTKLVVGTYNLQSTKPNDSFKQAELLKNNHVDICAVQEINYDNYRFSSEKFNGLAGFKKGDQKYADDFFGSAIEFAEGDMGVGTVSELALKNNRIIKLYSEDAKPETIDGMHKYYKEYNVSKPGTLKNLEEYNKTHTYIEPRIVTRSEIEIDGKTLAFYSTHLSFETIALRHAQLVQIRKILREDTADYKILAGDFNTDQSTKEIEFLRNEFTLANGNKGIWYDTFHCIDPTMNVYSIDNIMLSDNIKLLDTKLIQSDLSDHLALISTIDLL